MDETEDIRRYMLNTIEPLPDRGALEDVYGHVWNTEELRREFEVLGFAAPFVVVRRKKDGVRGSLQFQRSPRFYFKFQPDE